MSPERLALGTQIKFLQLLTNHPLDHQPDYSYLLPVFKDLAKFGIGDSIMDETLWKTRCSSIKGKICTLVYISGALSCSKTIVAQLYRGWARNWRNVKLCMSCRQWSSALCYCTVGISEWVILCRSTIV